VGSIKKDNNLSKRIETAIGKKENKTTNYDNLNVSLVNTFSRVATELLAGLIIGASVGWAIDTWLDTSPLFLIIFFLLGGAAGILNLWRIITGKGLKIGYFN
jgi:F0F1-type ATP synthase assembly protein I